MSWQLFVMYYGIVKLSCIPLSHWRNGKSDDSRPAVGGIWRLWKSTADLGRGIAHEITADDITFPTNKNHNHIEIYCSQQVCSECLCFRNILLKHLDFFISKY